MSVEGASTGAATAEVAERATTEAAQIDLMIIVINYRL
jgi:hypothetical protein